MPKINLAEMLLNRLTNVTRHGACACGGNLISVHFTDGKETAPSCDNPECSTNEHNRDFERGRTNALIRLEAEREAAKEQAERKAQDEADAKHKLGNRERFNNNFRSAR
jgi:hypothetical protein